MSNQFENLPQLTPDEKKKLDETQLAWENEIPSTEEAPAVLWRLVSERAFYDDTIKHTNLFAHESSALRYKKWIEGHGGKILSIAKYKREEEPFRLCLSRLEELRQLKPGWYEGDSPALSSEGLDWFQEVFEDHYSDSLELPFFIYPTSEGKVRLEWLISSHDISLEIDLVSHEGYYHALNLQSDIAVEKNLDLNKEEVWRWLFIRHIFED